MNAPSDFPTRALPARYYTDPALYARALERIFRNSW